MSTRILFAFLALLCCAAAPLQAQTTALFFDSQPGDSIGGGSRRTWTASDLTFSAAATSTSINVSATNFTTSPSTSWYLTFRVPAGQTLSAGVYELADSWAWGPTVLPGIGVSGNGRSCVSGATGRFVIHEITFSGTTVTRFAADFEQRCYDGPALFGAIRYNSTRASLVPFDGNYPVYSLSVTAAPNGYVTGPGIDCGAGRADCSEIFSTSVVATLTPTPLAGFVFLGWAGDCFGDTALVSVDQRRVCIPVFHAIGGAGVQSPDYSSGAIFVDEPGSTVSSRRRVVYPASLADIHVSGSASSVRVALDGRRGVGETFTFVPPTGGALAAGDYPYALGTGSSRGAFPGVESSYCGSGGRFRIYELTFSGGSIASFAADLEQRCGTGGTRPLVASIRYRSTRSSLLPFDGAYPFHRLGVQTTTGGRVSGTGIECGAGSADCEEVFTLPTTVTLQAVPSPGYEFLGWSGSCGGDSDTATVAVDRTRICTAYFHPTRSSGAAPDPGFASRMLFMYQPGAAGAQRRVWSARDAQFSTSAYFESLSVTAEGPHGYGGVTLAAARSSGVLTPGYYDEAYVYPNSKTARINTAFCSVTGGRFIIYEIATSSTGQLLTLAADFEVQCASNGPIYGAVRFNSTRAAVWPFDGAFPVYTLSIVPSSRGRVTAAGIDCGAGRMDCSETYATPQAIPIVATPNSGNVFVGWQGGCDGTAQTTVMIAGATRCSAMFVSPAGTAATEDPALSRGALLIESEPGEPIANGRRHLWASDADVAGNISTRNSVSLTVVQPNGGTWRLDFRAPGTADLTTGVYANAVHIYGSSTYPGMRIEGPSSYCSSIAGRFQVYEIAFETAYHSVRVTRFAADFEQQCGTASARLRGSIRFNSSRPNVIPFTPTYSLTQRNIVFGLSPYAYGGWMATRNGASYNYSESTWIRFPWPNYNDAGKGLRVAAGDVDGDGLDEIIAAVESGGDGWIAILDDGAHGFALMKWVQVPWTAYNQRNGAVWPAAGDLDGDGRAEIVLGLGSTGQGWFVVIDDALTDFTTRGWGQVNWPDYNAADGGTRPAVADVDGDGLGEIVLGLGPGSNGWIEVLNGAPGYSHRAWLRVPWSTYGLANGETFVAAGDLDGDNYAEIVAGLGTGGFGYLYIFDDAVRGHSGIAWRRTSWPHYADDPSRGQIYPAVGDVDGDGRAEIILGLGPHPNGGWFEILDDNGANNVSLGWRNLGWELFSAAGGGVFPAVGRFW